MGFNVKTMSSQEIGDNIKKILIREHRPMCIKELFALVGIKKSTIVNAVKKTDGLLFTNHLNANIVVLEEIINGN